MIANVVLCAGYAVTVVKGFTDACYKSEEGIIKGVVCLKDKENVRRHKEVIASLIKVKLRQS
jgi:hypothetical protein